MVSLMGPVLSTAWAHRALRRRLGRHARIRLPPLSCPHIRLRLGLYQLPGAESAITPTAQLRRFHLVSNGHAGQPSEHNAGRLGGVFPGMCTCRRLSKSGRKRGYDMLTIGVIGANGTAGTRVVARLKGRDVGGVEIARAYGVDLVSGQGLAEAPQGVDVVVDVSNPTPADERSDLAAIVTTASRNLVGACAAQGVQRLVAMTIAGIEDPAFDGFPYYAAKRVAKEIALTSPGARDGRVVHPVVRVRP